MKTEDKRERYNGLTITLNKKSEELKSKENFLKAIENSDDNQYYSFYENGKKVKKKNFILEKISQGYEVVSCIYTSNGNKTEVSFDLYKKTVS